MRSVSVISVRSKLQKAEHDPHLDIRHAIITQNGSHGLHAVEVCSKVQGRADCASGILYHVMSGSGLLYLAPKNIRADEPTDTQWQAPIEIQSGMILDIPPGRAHCLVSRDGHPLIITFLFDKDSLVQFFSTQTELTLATA